MNNARDRHPKPACRPRFAPVRSNSFDGAHPVISPQSPAYGMRHLRSMPSPREGECDCSISSCQGLTQVSTHGRPREANRTHPVFLNTTKLLNFKNLPQTVVSVCQRQTSSRNNPSDADPRMDRTLGTLTSFHSPRGGTCQSSFVFLH